VGDAQAGRERAVQEASPQPVNPRRPEVWVIPLLGGAVFGVLHFPVVFVLVGAVIFAPMTVWLERREMIAQW
jgi:hypothetical protein